MRATKTAPFTSWMALVWDKDLIAPVQEKGQDNDVEAGENKILYDFQVD